MKFPYPGILPAEIGPIFSCRLLPSNFDYIVRSGSVFAVRLVPWFIVPIRFAK